MAPLLPANLRLEETSTIQMVAPSAQRRTMSRQMSLSQLSRGGSRDKSRDQRNPTSRK